MLHGLLHLAGYDHEADDGRMARRERLLRARLGLPQGLIERAALPSKQGDRSPKSIPQGLKPISILQHSARLKSCPDTSGVRAHDPAHHSSLLLAVVETLASYISRVYAEFGKILAREDQENLDAWEELIEPQLGLRREHAAICAAVLQQLALGIIALEFGAVLFDRAPHLGRPTYAEIAQAVLAVVLVVVFCNQLLPGCCSTAPAGRWVGRLVWPIRLLLWLMTPITVFVRFFFSVASLAEAPATTRKRPPWMWRRCSKPAKKRGFWKRTTSTWCARRWSLATSWCAR